MKTLTKVLRSVTIATLLFAAGGTALGDETNELRFANELDRCVATVNSHLELTGADRVRHVVTQSGRSGIGYALTIRTSVFRGDARKDYSSYCVANGDHEPSKFRITAS